MWIFLASPHSDKELRTFVARELKFGGNVREEEVPRKGVAAITTTLTISIAVGVLGLVLGFVLNAIFQRNRLGSQRREVEEQTRQLMISAEREAENLTKEAKIEAKDLLFQAKAELEKKEKDK